jgi:arylsulfatase A-like enzyme/SAM-dependent methyltransferase
MLADQPFGRGGRPSRPGFVLALALSSALAAGACSDGCRSVAAPAVLLVVLDTVRADHLSCYGYERPTTPNLDRLAAEGELYRSAWAHSPWTLPAVASILTGLPPQDHMAGRAAGGGFYPVRAGVVTLAERMQAAGYRTGAVVNVEFLSPGSGIERGFADYDYWPSAAAGQPPRGARETTAAALSWAADQGAAPFFLVVHYFDPHLPFDPPPPYDALYEPEGGERAPRGFGADVRVVEEMRTGAKVPTERFRESLVARYDGEIRSVDEELGALRHGLEALGRWDSSLVVVVADHGEELWDHGGFEHGHSHHRELLRVPLIVRRPGGRHADVAGRVRQIDIVPTVLEFAGQGQADGLPGRALDGETTGDAIALGSLWAGRIASIRSDEGTLVVNLETGARQLFAPDDLAERTNVLEAGQHVATRLEGRLLQGARSTHEAGRRGRCPGSSWSSSEPWDTCEGPRLDRGCWTGLSRGTPAPSRRGLDREAVPDELQRRFWESTGKRRSHLHPVAEAFSRPKLEWIRRQMPDLGVASVLDVGSGNGYFTWLLDAWGHAVALDFAHAMLVQHPARLRVQGDAARLPVGDDAVDVAFCGNLLHHLPSPEAAVAEMARVARRYVVLVEPSRWNPAMLAFGLLEPAERGTVRFHRAELVRLLREADLDVVASTTMGTVLPNKTPLALLPFARLVDGETPLGFYAVAVGRVR